MVYVITYEYSRHFVVITAEIAKKCCFPETTRFFVICSNCLRFSVYLFMLFIPLERLVVLTVNVRIAVNLFVRM